MLEIGTLLFSISSVESEYHKITYQKISTMSGESFTGISQIKQVVEAHFQNLFSEYGSSNPYITFDFLSSIPCLVSEC